MNEDIVTMFMKILCINILTFIMNFKLLSDKSRKIYIVAVMSLVITIVYVYLTRYIDNLLNILVMYSLQLIILKCIRDDKNENIEMANLISNAIVYVLFGIAAVLECPIMVFFNIKSRIINAIFAVNIAIIITCAFLNVRRFDKGLAFLKEKINNEYISIIMFNISVIVIFAYYLYGNYYGNLTRQLLTCFIVLGICMLFMIQKTLTLYYKQKLLAKNIEEYKAEIASKDAQIKALSEEKYKISELNHQFYNRQKSLVHKVEEMAKMNTEIASELDITKQINDLTKEYTDKAQEIKTLDKLPATGITEIDDMFKYMQSECKSKNIQFNLQINGNIYHMVNTKIPENKLVTLIGDHLRDAIIAIEFSNNSFKSILAVLGENNGVYEFCVYDTGIEFEINTLLRLGIEPATTHKEAGGTGIGFMTTFETMKETKASLIINEMHEITNNDYTKFITIRFDGKNEYRIKSYRSDKIIKNQKDNRIIIENNSKDVPQSGTKKRT